MARPAANTSQHARAGSTRKKAETTRTDAAPVGGPGAPAQGRELRARGQATMRKLLDAGVQVFSAKGYHAARVDDIVEVARTSHGTFYLYFSNKEDLFAALVQDVADRLTTVTASLEPIGRDDHGRAVLRAWIAEFADIYGTYGAILRTWTEAEVDGSDVGAVGTGLLGDIAAALADHLEGTPRDLDPTIAALAVVAMVERLNYFEATGQVETERDVLLDLLSDVLHAALFATR
jgi:AcrR family transcriptional regulator